MSFKDLKGQLARCMERFQQYNFEIIYRKVSYIKTLMDYPDALVKIWSANILCEGRRGFKNGRCCRKDSLVGRKLINLAEQLEDPGISFFVILQESYHIKESYQGKETRIWSSWQVVASKKTAAKVYWSYWDFLEIKDSVLYKMWKAPNLWSTNLRSTSSIDPP